MISKTTNGLAGKLPFLTNIILSSTNHGRVRYVPFSNLFSKILSFWRRECSDYICLYSNQTPLPLFSLCLCPTLLKARVIVVGGEQNRPLPKDNPCSIFFRRGLSFFKGWRAGWRVCFLFFWKKHHYPFDLQVGPLLGTQRGGGGSWPLLNKS